MPRPVVIMGKQASVKDSSVTGKIIGKAEYLYGSSQLLLGSEGCKDEWYPEERVVIERAKPVAKRKPKAKAVAK